MVVVSTQQMEQARRLLEDGASYRETARTLGIGRGTVMRALPGYGWTYQDAGRHAMTIRWANRRHRKEQA